MFTFFHNIAVSIIAILAGIVGVHIAATTPPATASSSIVVEATTSTPLPVTEQITSTTNAPVAQVTNTSVQKTTVTAAPPPVQTPVVIVVPVVTASSDYSSYSILPSDFSKNTPHYVGTQMKISGTITDFLAKGERGAGANDIEITPYDTQGGTLPNVMLQIDSNVNYQDAVASLSAGDYVTAYGTVVASQQFTDSYGIVTNIIPVFDLTRLDKCDGTTTCGLNIGTQTVFPNIPVQSMVNSNFVSITKILQDTVRYAAKQITTQGKVYQIVPDPNGGSDLLLLQDPTQSSGSVAVSVTSAFLQSNSVKIGTILQITGTLYGKNSDSATEAYTQYGIIENSNSPYYIADGTVTVIN